MNRCGAALPANPKRPPLRGLPKYKRRCRPVPNKRGPKQTVVLENGGRAARSRLRFAVRGKRRSSSSGLSCSRGCSLCPPEGRPGPPVPGGAAGQGEQGREGGSRGLEPEDHFLGSQYLRRDRRFRYRSTPRPKIYGGFFYYYYFCTCRIFNCLQGCSSLRPVPAQGPYTGWRGARRCLPRPRPPPGPPPRQPPPPRPPPACPGSVQLGN